MNTREMFGKLMAREPSMTGIVFQGCICYMLLSGDYVFVVVRRGASLFWN